MPELFTVAEFQRIRAAAEPHLAWAMEVAYHTGVRTGPSELFALRWQDVDWDRQRLHVFGRKTQRWRWVPLPPAFLERLSARYSETKRRHPDCPWICDEGGECIVRLDYAWLVALKRAEIKRRIRIYDIRHYYATYALAAGIDIMELAYILGHSSAEMIVKVYAHRAKELKDRRQVTLPDIYGRQPGKAAKARG